jgi:hypothetical protein
MSLFLSATNTRNETNLDLLVPVTWLALPNKAIDLLPHLVYYSVAPIIRGRKLHSELARSNDNSVVHRLQSGWDAQPKLHYDRLLSMVRECPSALYVVKKNLSAELNKVANRLHVDRAVRMLRKGELGKKACPVPTLSFPTRYGNFVRLPADYIGQGPLRVSLPS